MFKTFEQIFINSFFSQELFIDQADFCPRYFTVSQTKD